MKDINEAKAHENDEGSENTYDDNDETFFFNSNKRCIIRRSMMVSLSNIRSYMLIHEGQSLSHVIFHFSCSTIRGMI
jgi:hypothetical protein